MTWHRPNSSAGKITSPFGLRGPIAGAPDASRYHLGVDLRAGTLAVPADIYAAADGAVRRIYRTPLGAWVLELDHGDKVWTRYVHMQLPGIAVQVGQKVTGGQRVAAASNSGAPTIHLHFEVLINGKQVDPVPWLKARGVDLTAVTTGSGGGTSAGLAPGGTIAIPTITLPEDDMTPDQEAKLDRALDLLTPKGQPYGFPEAILNAVRVVESEVRGVRDVLAVPGFPFDYPASTHNAVGALISEVAGLRAAVAALAAGAGSDPAAVLAAAKAGAESALKGITITVDTKGA